MLIFHIKKKNRKYELLEINLAFLWTAVKQFFFSKAQNQLGMQ